MSTNWRASVITRPTSFHFLLKQMYRWLFSAKMYNILLKSSDWVVSFSATWSVKKKRNVRLENEWNNGFGIFQTKKKWSVFGEERKWKRREWYKRKKVYKIIGRYRLSRRKPQGSGGGNAAVVCVRYASWHISEKRSPLEVYSASCTYIDGSERERGRARGPLPASVFGTGRKEEKVG